MGSGEGFAMMVTAEAKEVRDRLEPEMRLAIMDACEMLAADPYGFEDRSRKLPIGGGVFIYEHPSPALELTYELVDDGNRRIIRFLHFAVLRMELKKTLFISYSHADTDWLRSLIRFLRGLEDRNMSIWDDRQIRASQRWRQEIEKALSSARAALLLISQDFIDSPFIQEHELPVLLKKAAEEGLQIFWVPLRPSTVAHTAIAEFQAAVDDPSRPIVMLEQPEQEAQFVRVYERIVEALAS